MSKTLQLLIANYVTEYRCIPYELSGYSSEEIEECVNQLTADGLLKVWSTPIQEYIGDHDDNNYTSNTVSVSAYISPENFEKLINS